MIVFAAILDLFLLFEDIVLLWSFKTCFVFALVLVCVMGARVPPDDQGAACQHFEQ